MSNDLMTTEDGFDAVSNDRIIQGDLLKCNDGRWTCGAEQVDGGDTFLVVGTAECVQRWEGGKPVETITDKPLPNVDELNEAVPAAEWEEGIAGPRPPWQHQRAIYFIKPTSGAMYTYVSGTIGGRMAIQALAFAVSNMRKLRGESVLPVVSLGSKVMKTRFGQRIRPDFMVKDWRRPGKANQSSPQLENKTIGTSVKPPTAAEEMNDSIPW